MKKSIAGRLFDGVNIVLMIGLCFITIYPYLNQLAVSLNDGADTAWGGITIFPREFTLNNYIQVFRYPTLLNSISISVLRVAAGTLLSLFVTISAAYALTRRQLPGRTAIITFLLIPMFIGGGIIPTYILYRYLELLNSFWVYVFPGAFAFFNMIIVRTYLQSIPKEIEEAAVIDGANEVQTLLRIMIPLSMPVVATVSLWVAVANWNDWITSLMFVTKENLFPLQFVLMKLVKESEILQQMAAEQLRTGGGRLTARATPDAVKAAVLIVATLPIILLYPFLQKYFVKGVMIGGVKE